MNSVDDSDTQEIRRAAAYSVRRAIGRGDLASDWDIPEPYRSHALMVNLTDYDLSHPQASIALSGGQVTNVDDFANALLVSQLRIADLTSAELVVIANTHATENIQLWRVGEHPAANGYAAITAYSLYWQARGTQRTPFHPLSEFTTLQSQRRSLAHLLAWVSAQAIPPPQARRWGTYVDKFTADQIVLAFELIEGLASTVYPSRIQIDELFTTVRRLCPTQLSRSPAG